MAFGAGAEVAKQHPQWLDPVSRGTWGASPGAPLDGVDADTSVWATDRCFESLGKELTPPENRDFAPRVRDAGTGCEEIVRRYPPDGSMRAGLLSGKSSVAGPL